MSKPEADNRSPDQRASDERIASEPKRDPLDIPPGIKAKPLETHLRNLHRRPLALAGIVENGLVRPLDSNVKLPENARVIIIAAEPE